MIRAAFELLVSALNQYVRVNNQGDPVKAGNISFMESDATAGGGSVDANKVVVSLVNIEEEAALKNGANLRTVGASTFDENRPVFLNLFLLFSAHFNDYPTGLDALTQVIEFFQANKVFSFRHTPPERGLPDDPRVQELQIHLDLHTLTFQEINDLWGSLGGKQVPFVMYKARLLPVRARAPLEEARLIRRIDLDHGGNG
jgi:hypothetical protein